MQQQRQARSAGWLTENGVLLAILTMVFWGGNAVAGKFAVGNVSPFVLTFSRWVFAAALITSFAWPHLRKDWPVIRKNLGFLLIAGTFGFTAFNGMLYTSLKYTSAINVTILQAAMPMVIFALNFAIFGLRVHWAQALGYSITMLGVLMVAGRGDLGFLTDFSMNVGDLIMVVAVIVYAAYSVALRAKPDLHWLSFLAMLSIFALIASFPLAVFEVWQGDAILPTTPTAWCVIAYTALFPSLVSQASWIRSNELLGGNTASLFLNLVPIFGAVLSVMILGETFFGFHAVALTLVIGGIVFAQQLGRSR